MQAIAEISLYPLSMDYDNPILDFIRRLRAYPGIHVQPGETSTVVRGTYEQVFGILERECRVTLEGDTRAAFVIKLLNTV